MGGLKPLPARTGSMIDASAVATLPGGLPELIELDHLGCACRFLGLDGEDSSLCVVWMDAGPDSGDAADVPLSALRILLPGPSSLNAAALYVRLAEAVGWELEPGEVPALICIGIDDQDQACWELRSLVTGRAHTWASGDAWKGSDEYVPALRGVYSTMIALRYIVEHVARTRNGARVHFLYANRADPQRDYLGCNAEVKGVVTTGDWSQVTCPDCLSARKG